MIDHILLDMDGVLADFLSAALIRHGWTPKEFVAEGIRLEKNGEADSPIESDEITYPWNYWVTWEILQITEKQFWDGLHDHEGDSFFRDLPRFDYIDSLMKVIGNIPFTVLTTPSMHPGDATAKIQWLRDYFGSDFRDYMVGPQKWLMAKPNHLLIDDYYKNTESFVAKGGNAFMFPQPWNAEWKNRDRKLELLEDYITMNS